MSGRKRFVRIYPPAELFPPTVSIVLIDNYTSTTRVTYLSLMKIKLKSVLRTAMRRSTMLRLTRK